MTDRFHSLTVVLDDNYRKDDLEALMSAISQLRGVAAVSGIVADPMSHMAETRAKSAIKQRLWEALEKD
ncbi:hypothetical protein RYA05_03735 [Pseudomonas syringae pv. actinidiae]|nr:hypothetical protein [Pseudomonas syringae pv. actinidiae]